MNKKVPNYQIRSIRRAIKILNYLNTKKDGITLAELSEKINIDKSTTFRILLNLEDEEFVIKNQHTKKYYLGTKLFELGQNVSQEDDIRKIAFPYMKELNLQTEETVALYIPYDNFRVAIEKIESTLIVRHVIELGKPLPLYTAAPGKAILAFLSKEKVKKILDHSSFKKITKNTIIDTSSLLKELEKIKKDGYATSYGEVFPDAASIAVAIFNKEKKVIASLCLAGPISRFRDKKKTAFWISLLKDFCNKISLKIDLYK